MLQNLALVRVHAKLFFFFVVSDVMVIYFEGIDKIGTYYVFINCKSLQVTLNDY